MNTTQFTVTLIREYLSARGFELIIRDQLKYEEGLESFNMILHHSIYKPVDLMYTFINIGYDNRFYICGKGCGEEGLLSRNEEFLLCETFSEWFESILKISKILEENMKD